MSRNSQAWRKNGGVTQLVQAAERFIDAKNFKLALQQLAAAQELDPKNSYITAIVHRVREMEDDHKRYLSVTVGKEFKDGIKGLEDEPALSAREVRAKVRTLTNAAERFLEEGSVDSAFESLMKAFLLDPVSPDVVTCEKSVLPAWEKRRSTTVQSQKGGMNLALREDDPTSFFGPTNNRPERMNREQRLEALKAQREAERIQREQEQWRKASSPPKAIGNSTESGSEQPEKKEESSLFNKLRLGKFLG